MLAASAGSALAAVRGFNYASQGEQNANTVELEPASVTDRFPGQTQSSFEAQFQSAAGLEGADDYTSARL